MKEAFLVNPYRRKSIGKSRRKHHGLPSALLKRMMRTYGRGRGMREAWKAYRGGARRNPWSDDARGHRKAARLGWSHRRRRVSGRRRKNPWEQIHYRARTSRLWRGHGGRFGLKRAQKNPFGEEVMIVGNRVRRRKRYHRSNDPARRRYRHNARRRHYMRHNPRRRYYRRHNRYRRRYMRHNPRRYYRRFRHNARRRYRHNPEAGVPSISIRKPLGFLMPAAIGTLGFVATSMIPGFLGATFTGTSYMRQAVKAAIAIGGGMALGKFMGKKNGLYFAIGAGINLLVDVLNTYVFTTSPLALSGIGAFPQLGAFPFGDVGDMGVGPYSAQTAGMYAGGYGSGYPM